MQIRIFKLITKIVLPVIFVILLFSPTQAFAQPNVSPHQPVYCKAEVDKILEQGQNKIEEITNPYQKLQLHLLDCPDAGKTITITQGKETSILPQSLAKTGDILILASQPNSRDNSGYVIYDKYRLDHLLIIGIVFLIIVFMIAGLRGMGSLIGLLISLAVILFFIIPQIIAGQNPIFIGFVGSVIILLVTTYIAHGISRQTTTALLSTFAALVLALVIANFFVNFADLSGLNDETSTLIFGPTSKINLQGLLLAGLIIGTLGALNDVTITQAAAVFELARTDHKLKFSRLFSKGMSIGREHIISMVNTLVLAYAGSSLILFIFIVLNPAGVPPWVFINNELISDEIVRTLAGSIALLSVVPIVTAAAAFASTRKT